MRFVKLQFRSLFLTAIMPNRIKDDHLKVRSNPLIRFTQITSKYPSKFNKYEYFTRISYTDYHVELFSISILFYNSSFRSKFSFFSNLRDVSYLYLTSHKVISIKVYSVIYLFIFFYVYNSVNIRSWRLITDNIISLNCIKHCARMQTLGAFLFFTVN